MSLSRLHTAPYESRASGFFHWAEDGRCVRRVDVAERIVRDVVEMAMGAENLFSRDVGGTAPHDLNQGARQGAPVPVMANDEEYLKRLMAQIDEE